MRDERETGKLGALALSAIASILKDLPSPICYPSAFIPPPSSFIPPPSSFIPPPSSFRPHPSLPCPEHIKLQESILRGCRLGKAIAS